ncbi:MAG: NAD(P)-dependent oxidoreductase, partial [Mucinivorans sp.]
MKEIVVIDSKIPFIAGVFEPWCRVIYSDHITHEQAHAARVLVVRTRTQCNGELLRGSSVGFIATATIGTDHIDLDYCHDHGIVVQSAAGCNARAVAQWVFAALRSLGIKGGTLGIVGVGNVGRQVMAMAQQRGFSLLLNDPPRADSGESGFVELDYLLRHSDVVTLHTPLTLSTR